MDEANTNLKDEFRNLGENLKQAFQTGWESEERKQLQREVEAGLKELGAMLNEAANDLRESKAGQQIKEGFEEVRESIRSGEAEANIRAGLISALEQINAELQKAIWGWKREEE